MHSLYRQIVCSQPAQRFTIIIDCFRLATRQPFRSYRFAKKEGTILYGYRIEKDNSCTSVFPKQSRTGTARMKYERDTDEDGKKKGVCVERSKSGMKKK